jgi:hypothetical protein
MRRMCFPAQRGIRSSDPDQLNELEPSNENLCLSFGWARLTERMLVLIIYREIGSSSE